MHAEYDAMRRLGKFSLDDPEAGRKLIENLDRRKVRLQVVEMCWHFGIPFPGEEDRRRVKAFLDDLCRLGELRQPTAGLYCRPDLVEGRASMGDAAGKLATLFRRADAAGRCARAAADEAPKESLSAYKKRIRLERTPAPKTAAPAPSPAPPSAPPPPRGRPVSQSQLQAEWILLWLLAHGGTSAKAAMTEAAKAEGLILDLSDLDVTFQRLINRTRLYQESGTLKLTRFGEQEAEYLHARRDALGPSVVVP